MSTVKIKKKALESIIEKSISETQAFGDFSSSESFRIHEGDGFQVIVTVTCDEDEFIGPLPAYDSAKA